MGLSSTGHINFSSGIARNARRLCVMADRYRPGHKVYVHRVVRLPPLFFIFLNPTTLTFTIADHLNSKNGYFLDSLPGYEAEETHLRSKTLNLR